MVTAATGSVSIFINTHFNTPYTEMISGSLSAPEKKRPRLCSARGQSLRVHLLPIQEQANEGTVPGGNGQTRGQLGETI